MQGRRGAGGDRGPGGRLVMGRKGGENERGSPYPMKFKAMGTC